MTKTVVAKRDDPKYAQVSGYIPKKLALKFKANCTMQETDQSEALERAITLWLEEINQEREKETTSTSKSSGK
ncbi:hypothetical protein IQ249_15060 [Lusitaniella coriacea LEGE 07157]|uniref:Uncharacterized protein n=1 Tax=Lusitaniella coriacea LEGE 07157 TaxID=945747 RepID=A0A8J7DXW0_9CYAN|nr:hypothetical protein [Lusitaniella coriacea]MBE9117218.1 hypothetical protein [Lusitaniella coriacea LEGE 07157]